MLGLLTGLEGFGKKAFELCDQLLLVDPRFAALFVFVWLSPSRDLSCDVSKRIQRGRDGEKYWCLIPD